MLKSETNGYRCLVSHICQSEEAILLRTKNVVKRTRSSVIWEGSFRKKHPPQPLTITRQPPPLQKFQHTRMFSHSYPQASGSRGIFIRVSGIIRGLYHFWRSLHAHIRMNRWLHKVFNPVYFSTMRAKLA